MSDKYKDQNNIGRTKSSVTYDYFSHDDNYKTKLNKQYQIYYHHNYLALKHNLISIQTPQISFSTLIIYIIIGQLISLASLNHLYFQSHFSSSFNNNLLIIIFFLIIQYLFITIIMLIILRTFTKPKLVYIVLSILYSINTIIEHLGYNEKDPNYRYIALVWGFLFLIIYYSFYKLKNHSNYKQRQRQNNMRFGLLISGISFIFTIIVILFKVFNSNISRVFMINSFFTINFMRNNLLTLIHGLSYSLRVYLHEKHLNSNSEIVNGLLWISICSSLFSLTTLFFITKGNYDYFKLFFIQLDTSDAIKDMTMIIIDAVWMVMFGWFINNGSALMVMLCMTMQVYWRFVIGYYNNMTMTIIEIGIILFGYIGCIIGMGVYIKFHTVWKSEEINEDYKKKLFMKQSKGAESIEIDNSFSYNSVNSIDDKNKSDVCSECSAFSVVIT